ncbi:nucleolin-like isoform X2 [Kryptolebias marmoratus]|uniref:nucleolin-like isoform X2 n=1 Tax=Kryptolebias marmoratus TaxID=37003 RepID=UPI000D530537|nr:nucleolin-like isoform X2 [Kryptolebias marmoratus]
MSCYSSDESFVLHGRLRRCFQHEWMIESRRKSNVVEGDDDTPNTVSTKRMADPETETSPSKKTKLINDGFCLYVGNLNNWKTSQEIKDSLATYFMTHSLLFQDIQLDRSRKHAFVDMASEMDLNKALTLNGEEVLDKPMKIAKAKVKSDSKEKVKHPEVDKKVNDGRCLFLKNVPYNATKEDIQKMFHKAIAVRFPGGAKNPNKGIAFVEFKNKAIAKKMLKKKQSAKIQDRDLIVDTVRERNAPKEPADGKNTEATPPTNVLFVSNLPKDVRQKHLKKIFKKAVCISIPQAKNKPKRCAYVKFATVKDAEKVLLSSKDILICKKVVKVDFSHHKMKPKQAEASSKTLFVGGLAAKTTAETLKSAFEGAVSARVAVHKDTGVSKRFGFVEFESEESCKAAKNAMEDCEIDGSKVTLDVALSKGERGQQGAGVGSEGPPKGTEAH